MRQRVAHCGCCAHGNVLVCPHSGHRRHARCTPVHARSVQTLLCSCEPHPILLGAVPYIADMRRKDSALGKWQRDREWRGERSGVLAAGRRHVRRTRTHVYSAGPIV